MGAGSSNVAGSGKSNTFAGYQAGLSNTPGVENTFTGSLAGLSNTTGVSNTFSGFAAGYFNNGDNNTFSGYKAGEFNTTGVSNTFTGSFAGINNTTGSSNEYSGSQAGFSNTLGSTNTFIGDQAGINNTSGSLHVYIANPGGASESNTIRIGQAGYHSAPYIEGIYSRTIGNGITVLVNSSSQLGTNTSSRRFKEQILDMGDSTSGLMKLRPVTYFYKQDYDKGPRTLQYGLIAEEVAEVYPDWVAYEADGKPFTVKHQYLTTMLLNEMQKQYHRAEAEAEVIKTQQRDMKAQAEVMRVQQQEIDGLRAQLQLQNAAFKNACRGWNRWSGHGCRQPPICPISEVRGRQMACYCLDFGHLRPAVEFACFALRTQRRVQG